MSKVFFGGSRKLPRLNSALRTRLRNLITNEHIVLIGDASGADKAAQTFFAEEGYKNVVVYCMDGDCRNNIGNWEVKPIASGEKKKDFKYFAIKDAEMSREADYGFMLWDGKSKGTLNNVLNLLQQNKMVLIYFSPSKSFVSVKTLHAIEQLIAQCTPEAKNYFDKSIKFSERTQLQQTKLNFANKVG